MFNRSLCMIAGAVAAGASMGSVAEAASITFQGNEYFLTNISGTWNQAQAEAQSVGGNLVTVNSAEENEFLFDNFVKNDDNTFNRLWIGLTDQEIEGTFQWVSGEPVTYTNFRSGEPNDNPPLGEDFVEIGFLDAAQWNDGNDRLPFRGIVEKQANPFSTSIPEPTSTVSILVFGAAILGSLASTRSYSGR